MRAYRTQPPTQVRRSRFSRRKRPASQSARSTPASVPASSSLDTSKRLSQTPEIWRDDLDRWLNARDGNKKLIQALLNGGHDTRANKVRMCRTVVDHQDDRTDVNTWSCSERFCLKCSRRRIIQRTTDVAEAFTMLHGTHSPDRYRWMLVTLTIDDERVDGCWKDPRPKAKALRSEMTRILNMRWWKKNVKGVYAKIEAPFTYKSGARKGRSNVHAHMLVIADVRNQEMRDWLKNNYRLASVIDVRRFRFAGEKSVFEITKGIASYLAKEWDYLNVHQLQSLIEAFTRLRSSSATGVVRKALALVKDRRQEGTGKEVPAPPPKPEVENDLPEGRYDKGGILVAAMNGSVIAAWVMRLIAWEAVYGHSYRAQSGVDPPPP